MVAADFRLIKTIFDRDIGLLFREYVLQEDGVGRRGRLPTSTDCNFFRSPKYFGSPTSHDFVVPMISPLPRAAN